MAQWNCHWIGDKPSYLGYVPLQVEEPEVSFGDYRPGRYVWITKNPIQFQMPVPYKGHQGFFEVA